MTHVITDDGVSKIAVAVGAQLEDLKIYSCHARQW